MQMTKKVLAVVLSVMMVVSMMTVMAVASVTTASAATSKTVYFTKPGSWSGVSVYAWDVNDADVSAAWPGDAATFAYKNDFNEDVYSYSVPSTATGIIFSDNGANQTANITSFADYEQFYIDNGNVASVQLVAKVGTKLYSSFASAVTAANGSLINVLVKDATPYVMSVGQSIVTDNYTKITVQAPAGAYAIHRTYDSTAKTYTFTVIDAVASYSDGTTTYYFDTLNAAISAVPSATSTNTGTYTVNLLQDSTESSINVGSATAKKNVIIDLGGNTLTLNRNYTGLFLIRNGSNVEVKNGEVVFDTVNANASGFVVQDSAASSLTLDDNLNIEATGNTAGVFVQKGTLNCAADITTDNSFTIATNGSSTTNATINVTGSTLTSNNVAVYLPGQADATFTDCNITGSTAVYVKGGTVEINGGSLNATGAAADWSYNGNGCNATGDAIVVENAGAAYNNGNAPAVTIADGTTFTVTDNDAYALGAYTKEDDADVTVTLDDVAVPSVYADANAQITLDNGATASIVPEEGNTVVDISGVQTVVPVTHVAAAAATCAAPGNIEYWYVEATNKYYSDADLTTEISQAETVIAIDSTAHVYTENPTFDWTQDATTGDWKATKVTLTCANDPSHTKDYSLGLLGVKTTANADGTFTYTASKTIDGVVYSESKTNDANYVIKTSTQLRLAAAIGGEWTLGKDVDKVAACSVADDFVLNGDGHKLTGQTSTNLFSALFTPADANSSFTLNNVIIDGGNKRWHAVTSYTSDSNNSGNHIVLNGVTVQNFKSGDYTGAVYAFGSATIELNDCTVTGNANTIKTSADADNSGKDIWAGAKATIIINDGEVGEVLLHGGTANVTVKGDAEVDTVRFGYTNSTEDSTKMKAVVEDGTVGEFASYTDFVEENVVIDPDNATVEAPEGYKWVNSVETGMKTLAPCEYVAQNGTTKYESLALAVADAADGDTITLLADVTVNSQINIDKDITIDGDGNTITCTYFDDYATVGSFANGAAFQLVGNTRAFTIENATLDGDDTGSVAINAYRDNSNSGNVITLNNVEVTGFVGYEHYGAVKLFAQATLEATGCDFHDNTLGNRTQGWAGASDIWAGGLATVSLTNTTAEEVFLNGTAGNGADLALVNSTVDQVNIDLDYNNASITVDADSNSTVGAVTVSSYADNHDNQKYIATESGDTTTYIPFKATKVDAVAATFDAPGNTEYYVGNDGKYYSDAAGENEIAENSWVIPQLVAAAIIYRADGVTVDKYTSFAGSTGAWAALQDGDTIQLQKNCYYNGCIGVADNKEVTFDLNGFNSGSVSNYGAYVEAGSTLNFVNTKADTTSYFLTNADGYYAVYNDGTVNVGENVVVQGNKTGTGGIYANDSSVTNINGGTVIGRGDSYAGIVVWNDNTVNVNSGTVRGVGTFAISGNGNAGNDGNVINVNGGTVSSDTASAIYQPNDGEVNVYNGTVSGKTAIYAKAGKVKVEGGNIVATKTPGENYAYNGNGCTATGDAIVVDNCGYPGGTPAITVSGGTFTVADTESCTGVGSYVKQDDATYAAAGFDRLENFVEGGSFNTPVPEEQCALGFVPAPLDPATNMYTVQVDPNPLNPVEVLASAINDGNAFGLSDIDYLKGSLLGVQRKNAVADAAYTSESGQEGDNGLDTVDMRFIAVLDTDILNAADDYGFVLAKVNDTKDYSNTNFENLKANKGNGEKTISAKGTSNNVCGNDETTAAYGDPNANTPYKYITCAVNGVEDDGTKVVARFYVKINGTYYYAKYAKDNYAGGYTGMLVSFDDIVNA